MKPAARQARPGRVLSLPRLSPLVAGTMVGVACFLLAFLLLGLAVTTAFRTADRRKAEETLAIYLQRYRQGGIPAVQDSFPGLSAGHGPSFLRLTGPHIRLVLLSAETGRSGTVIPDFDSFATDLNRTWTTLHRPGARGPWTVASARTGDGTVVQVGIDCRESLALLARTRRMLLVVGLALLPLAVVPALYMDKVRKKLAARINRAIGEAAAGGTPGPLAAGGSTREERQLVAAVNRLVERHHRLTRELEESMDNVAHDLRTPMTRLRAAAEYGLQEFTNTGQLRESLADCLEESERVLAMLNTMLTVAEARAGSVDLSLEQVDLRDIVAQVVEMYQLLAEERHVRIRVEAPEPVRVMVDRTRMGQVWANLLDNAIKYGADRIRITLDRREGMAEGRIEDNGMGISAAEMDRIWERLFRGDRSRNRPGLGLGLTLVRALVRAHKGTIEVRSRLNSGTTFIVRLPLA